MDPLTTLLLAAQAGDARSLAAFVRQTQPDVWRMCRYLVGPSDADDATQETYLAAWRALPAFRGDASARTWLFAIARRTAAREVRRRDRWAELAARAGELAWGGDPQGDVEVDALLAQLDLDRRLAFVLTQLFGLSYDETAVVCDCPVGTIRSRVARARRQLVELWDRGNREPDWPAVMTDGA